MPIAKVAAGEEHDGSLPNARRLEAGFNHENPFYSLVTKNGDKLFVQEDELSNLPAPIKGASFNRIDNIKNETHTEYHEHNPNVEALTPGEHTEESEYKVVPEEETQEGEQS